MEKNSCPINTIACGNEDGLFLLCSLVVAQERPVELEIQQLLTREVSLTKHLEIVRQTLRVVFYIESRRFLIRDSPRPATTYEQKTGGADGVKGA